MAKYSAKYLDENAIACTECGKGIFRQMAIYADGIQVCSTTCAENVLANIEAFDRLNNTPEKIALRLLSA